MPNYRRGSLKGGTYFFTVVTYRRQQILCNKNIMAALRNGIQDARKHHPFEINGWVLLPDHIHCIWTLPANDANFSIRWAIIKRTVSKQCGPSLQREGWVNESRLRRKESALWQRRFWEHQIRDECDYERHMNYLHFNPVKHGYVKSVADWPHSTFHRYVNQGVYEKDWASNDSDTIAREYGE